MTLTVNYVFDATQHAPEVGYDPVPAGVYNVVVSNTEIAEIKDGKGQTFVVTLQIADGEFAGRKLYNNYNIWHNSSADSVRIAHGQLSALCHVTGIFRVDFNNAGAELRGGRLRVVVEIDGKYNRIKEVQDINGNKASKAGSGFAPASANAQFVSAAPVQQQQQQQAAPAQQNWGQPQAAPAQQGGFAAHAPAPLAQQQQQQVGAASPWGQATDPATTPASVAPWGSTPPVA